MPYYNSYHAYFESMVSLYGMRALMFCILSDAGLQYAEFGEVKDRELE